jgi:hypothetical protein
VKSQQAVDIHIIEHNNQEVQSYIPDLEAKRTARTGDKFLAYSDIRGALIFPSMATALAVVFQIK